MLRRSTNFEFSSLISKYDKAEVGVKSDSSMFNEPLPARPVFLGVQWCEWRSLPVSGGAAYLIIGSCCSRLESLPLKVCSPVYEWWFHNPLFVTFVIVTISLSLLVLQIQEHFQLDQTVFLRCLQRWESCILSNLIFRQ